MLKIVLTRDLIQFDVSLHPVGKLLSNNKSRVEIFEFGQHFSREEDTVKWNPFYAYSFPSVNDEVNKLESCHCHLTLKMETICYIISLLLVNWLRFLELHIM